MFHLLPWLIDPFVRVSFQYMRTYQSNAINSEPFSGDLKGDYL